MNSLIGSPAFRSGALVLRRQRNLDALQGHLKSDDVRDVRFPQPVLDTELPGLDIAPLGHRLLDIVNALERLQEPPEKLPTIDDLQRGTVEADVATYLENLAWLLSPDICSVCLRNPVTGDDEQCDRCAQDQDVRLGAVA